MTATDVVCWMDGDVVPAGEARVPVLDHGFLFGDSVYEAVRTVGGRPYLLDEHLRRLRGSAEGIGLEIPVEDPAIARAVDRVIAAREGGESYVRIVVSRGSGPLHLLPDGCEEPRLLVLGKPLPAWNEIGERGAHLVVCRRRRLCPEALDPRLKTGNYLNSLLALVEARRTGADDGILLDRDGNVAEATLANVFAVDPDGSIRTPAGGCLLGITRAEVIELARDDGWTVEETDLPREDLDRAHEVFLTSTTRGVMPVASIDGRDLPRAPGPATVRLRELHRARLDRFRRGEEASP